MVSVAPNDLVVPIPPPRFLYLPRREITFIDERDTLARSLLAPLISYPYSQQEHGSFGNTVFSLFSFAGLLGAFVLFIIIMSQLDSSFPIHWLRIFLWVMLPVSFGHSVAFFGQLVTPLLMKCLKSFQVFYLTLQNVALLFAFCYVFQTEPLLILAAVVVCIHLQHLILIDSMSRQRRVVFARIALLVAICGCLTVGGICFLSPMSTSYQEFTIPGSLMLTGAGLHLNDLDLFEFIVERLLTMAVFFIRFAFKLWRAPDDTVTLNVAYANRAETRPGSIVITGTALATHLGQVHHVGSSATPQLMNQTSAAMAPAPVVDIAGVMLQLELPHQTPLAIDEQDTLGRILFGDIVADSLLQLRSFKRTSLALFVLSNCCLLSGFSLLIALLFSTSVDLTSLRVLIWCLLPAYVLQTFSATMRLVFPLFLICLNSFDIFYITLQGWSGYGAWVFIFRHDPLMIIVGIILSWAAQNVVLVDCMSVESRQRTARFAVVGSAVGLVVMIVACKIAPASPLKLDSTFPLIQWFGKRQVYFNAIDFLSERWITICIFCGRLMYRLRYFPNDAVNLNVAYIYREDPVV